MPRGDVTIRIVGDASSLGRELGTAEGHLDRFSSRVGSVMRGASIALGAGVVAAGAFGVSAVNAASDLNESMSRVDTIFGESAATIHAWAQTTATGIGISRREAEGAAGTFGNVLTQLGIGADQAGALSTRMVELAGDFASFHNANPADVIDAQTAAFRGEYDALQRFVPTINAAAVEQRALADSGKATADQLTAQDRALAVTALMLDGAGEAAGDFARTSDGLANQQRIMAARFDDLKTRIGTALIPVVLRAAAVFQDDVIPALEVAADFISRNLQPVIASVVAFIQDNWPQISTTIGEVMGRVRAVIEAVVIVVSAIWRQFGDTITTVVVSAFGAVRAIVEVTLNVIKGVIDTVTAVIRGDWGAAWNAIRQLVVDVFNGLRDYVTNVLGIIRAVITSQLQVVVGVFSTAWNGIRSAASDALRFVGDQIGQIPGRILGVVGAVASAARGVGAAILSGIGDALGAAWNVATNIVGDIASGIRRAVNGVLASVEGWINAGLNAADAAAGPFINFGAIHLPRFHSGGIYRSPNGEGLAILRDREGVFTPEQMAAMGGTGDTYVIHVHGSVMAEQDLVYAVRDGLARINGRGDPR